MIFLTKVVGLLCFAVIYASSQPYDLEESDDATEYADDNDNIADEFEINALERDNVASDRLHPIDDLMGMEQYDTFDDYIPVMPRSKREIKSKRRGGKPRARLLPKRKGRISTDKGVRRWSKPKPSTKVKGRLPHRRIDEMSIDKRVHRGSRPTYTRRRGDRISTNRGFVREREPRRQFPVDTAVDVVGGIVRTIGDAAKTGAEVALANKQKEKINQDILHDQIRFQHDIKSHIQQLYNPDDNTDDSKQELNNPKQEDNIPDTANQADNTDDSNQESYSPEQEGNIPDTANQVDYPDQ